MGQKSNEKLALNLASPGAGKKVAKIFLICSEGLGGSGEVSGSAGVGVPYLFGARDWASPCATGRGEPGGVVGRGYGRRGGPESTWESELGEGW